jgi:predicted N-acyltransferase
LIQAPESSTRRFNRIQPLLDDRWNRFVNAHERASVFHSSAWLSALQQTYGYEPVAYTTNSRSSDLDNAVVFCRVDSWITGRRLVSLPFSDHCDPLVDDPKQLKNLFAILDEEVRRGALKYVELRPLRVLTETGSLFQSVDSHYLHIIDLRPDLDTLFKNCHMSSTRRKIRRAAREQLTYHDGNSESLLDAFYRLLVLTRRRHGIPPQPKLWFRNLIRSFGPAVKIRLAAKDGRPIAAILTILHGETLFYKYGCSDHQFKSLGGTHLLIWRSIQEAKQQGLLKFDLGRSALAQGGLITFKDRWGAERSQLTYSRFTRSSESPAYYPPSTRIGTQLLRCLSSCSPAWVATRAGSLLYKHIG